MEIKDMKIPQMRNVSVGFFGSATNGGLLDKKQGGSFNGYYISKKKACPPESYFDKLIDRVENDLHNTDRHIPIVDDVTDIHPDDLYTNLTVLDRIEEHEQIPSLSWEG